MCHNVKYDINSGKKLCQHSSGQGENILERASHAITITQSTKMWVVSGITSINNASSNHRENLNRALLYDFEKSSWSPVKTYSSYSSEEMRYGHTLVEYGGSLFLFGGTVYKNEDFAHPSISNDLLEYKTNTNSWESHTSDAIPVTGHASVVIQGHIYSFFGYNEKYILFNRVQKLNLSQNKKTWTIVDTKGALIKGRSGHTATYDSVSNTVFIFGGYASSAITEDNELLLFNVAEESWSIGASAPSSRVLHAAGIVGNNFVIFGGNSNVRSHRVSSCFNNDLLVYSIDCNKWIQKSFPLLDEEKRYGHSAVIVNNSIHVFGGFNGQFLNDVFEIAIGDDCGGYLLKGECLKADPLSGCVWHIQSKKCIRFQQNIPTSAIEKPECEGASINCNLYNTCTRCLGYTQCDWLKDECFERNPISPYKDPTTCPLYETAVCSTFSNCYSCHQQDNCTWTGNSCSNGSTKGLCFSNSNATSCSEFNGCSTCVESENCLWCESTQTCLPSNMYVANFPYGQCMEYIQDKASCSVAKCEQQYSCRNCLQLPQCGWCESTNKCTTGGDEGPINGQCPKNDWMFTKCPKCDCNGHSKCDNITGECLQCNENVIGDHCNECAHGYYGNPANNGSCSNKCECNGHLLSCDVNGECVCSSQGVTGSHCDKCDVQYEGDPRNGGICYYPLLANYQYTSSMSSKKQSGYVLKTKDKKPFKVKIERLKGNIGSLNITIVYANNETTELVSAYPLGEYSTTITEDTYDYSGVASIYVVVYGWEQSSNGFAIKIFFDPDDNAFDLVYFLIMFIVCFVSLLVILVILWKVKQRYDRYMYNRRQKQEMEERISRPFTSMKILLRDKTDLPSKEKVKHPPSLIGIQLLRQANNCGPASFLVRLPCEQNTQVTPAGQCGICIGTVLISQPSKRTKMQMQNSTRRKRTNKALPV
uniref:Laminin EGF-like domain-containing protein n=2 Tax=Clytia hemisphaerica TaxID=252671 RepID=A0A7M5WL61_9CNID